MRNESRSTLVAAAILAALALPCGSRPAAASDADGGQPGSWLMNYSSARTTGMGSAFAATADDPLGVLWNPAGLPWMEQNQLTFETAQMFEGTSVNGAGFAVPGSWFPSLGVSMVSLRSGDFERTNDINDNLGSFHEGETAYLFTVARAVSTRAALGANLKVVQQTIESFSAGGFGADAGALLQLTRDLRLGVSVLNLGGPSVTLRDSPEKFPMQVRAGVALGVLGGRGQVAAELDRTDGAALRLHGGTEYWISPPSRCASATTTTARRADCPISSGRVCASITASPTTRSDSSTASGSACGSAASSPAARRSRRYSRRRASARRRRSA